MERFGTDGIRFIYQGESSPFFAYRLGRAIAQLPGAELILVGRDNRPSGKALASSLISGLHSFGMVALDLGEVSTPAFAYCLSRSSCQYGVMVTASHNPPEDNGFKVYAGNAHKIPADLQRFIEEHLSFSGATIGSGYPNEYRTPSPYIEAVLDRFSGKTFSGRYLFDFANGSSSNVAKEVLSKLVPNASFIHDGDGDKVNLGCGAMHPEDAIKKGADYDLAFAFDGDGDRVQAYLSDGTFLDGASFLYGFGLLQDRPVVSTILSSLALKEGLSKAGIPLYQEAVGDAGVLEKMDEVDALLGGEPSGHLIFRDFSPSGDGLYAALKLIELKEENPTAFAKLVGFKPYPILQENLVYPSAEDAAKACAESAFQAALKEIQAGFAGRIIVRPSGTEPLLRLFIESPNETENDTIKYRLLAALGR